MTDMEAKTLLIPVGNLVLLRDHPEGRNKIQDVNKSTLFIVTGLHKDPSTYYIKPMEEKGPVKAINRCQLHNLGIIKEEEEQLREAGFTTGADSVPSAPVYIPKLKKVCEKENKSWFCSSLIGSSCRCQSGFCRVGVHKVVTQSILIIQKCVFSGYPSKKVV